MGRGNRLWVVLFVLVGVALVSWGGTSLNVEAPVEVVCREHSVVSRKVLAFYYPWYGTVDGPGGAGRAVHWRGIDAANKDIESSTNYPILGAYDSHDTKLLEKHCQWARVAGLDGFIVSWWGHDSYSDRAMEKILDSCRQHGLSACIYYETVPKPQTPQSAADDIVKVLNRYGGHSAYLKAKGKPVVFVYGRAVRELGLTGWLKAIELVNEKHKGGVTVIGDPFSHDAARVFDGVHTYNTAGRLRGLAPAAAREWAGETYRSWVLLANQAERISTLTVIPGYDDTKVRKPGLAVERYGGELYRLQWEEAIKAEPDWILITSFNEWHEGSEIEPSLEYKHQYLELTGEYAKRFKASVPIGFPELPPIANADPSIRHPKEFQVPTKLRVERTDEQIAIAVDTNSLESIQLKVGANMLTGFKHEMRVFRNEELILSGYIGLTDSTKADIGTIYLNRTLHKIPQPGEKYVVEICFKIFETDIPAQHMWSPQSSDKYRVLWTRMLRQTVE